MTDGSLTGRDHAAAIATRIALEWDARGYLCEFSPETVADVAADLDLDVSTRTVRRVLDALANDSSGILEDVSEDGRRLYRLDPGVSTPRFDKSVNELELESAARSGDDLQDIADVERSVDAVTSPDSPLRDVLILHLFADWGVESEALSAYGRVVRIGLDPIENDASDALRADALEPPVREVFDLVVGHPPCQRWSTLTPATGDPDAWPNLIPETREIARDLGRDYVIENVPQAPLEDPIVLSGRNFGLAGPPFRRAFETSFSVDEPPEPADVADRSGPFADEDGGLGSWRGSKLLWRTIKHVSGDYPSEAIKNNGIPAPYIHYLAYFWLRSRPDLLDQDAPTDLASVPRGRREAGR